MKIVDKKTVNKMRDYRLTFSLYKHFKVTSYCVMSYYFNMFCFSYLTDGPKLFPADTLPEYKDTQEMISLVDSLQMRTLTFGSVLYPDLIVDNQMPEAMRTEMAGKNLCDPGDRFPLFIS